MANSKFSEKSSSDERGLHTTQSTMLPQNSFCREAELIYAILLRKHFFGGHLEIYSKNLCKTIMMFCLLLLLVSTQWVSSLTSSYKIYHYTPPPPSPFLSLPPSQSRSASVDCAYGREHALLWLFPFAFSPCESRTHYLAQAGLELEVIPDLLVLHYRLHLMTGLLIIFSVVKVFLLAFNQT